MSVAASAAVEAVAARALGKGLAVEILKDKPGRRRTVRATGPGGTAVVKAYASDRTRLVADRLAALASGPPEPVVPRVLLADHQRRVLVLSMAAGRPLADAVDAGDLAACRRAGAALGRWHRAWTGRAPDVLRPHTAARELAVLESRAAAAPAPIAAAVRRLAPALGTRWACSTAVHRDLYEEQIILGDDGAVALIDLDDAGRGPAELDVGNLVAHLHWRGESLGRRVERPIASVLDGYAGTGPRLRSARLRQCWLLSRLRLACIHGDPALLPA